MKLRCFLPEVSVLHTSHTQSISLETPDFWPISFVSRWVYYLGFMYLFAFLRGSSLDYFNQAEQSESALQS